MSSLADRDPRRVPEQQRLLVRVIRIELDVPGFGLRHYAEGSGQRRLKLRQERVLDHLLAGRGQLVDTLVRLLLAGGI